MIWGGVGYKGDRDAESWKIYGGMRWRDGEMERWIRLGGSE